MAGMNILQMLEQAQGGNAISNLGRQFGLDDNQASSAVKALLPALSSGLKRNAASPQGLEALLTAVQSGAHERYLDTPDALNEPAARDEGNAILGHLLGHKDVSRAAAAQAAAQTGIDSGILKQMLPLLAGMAMGGVAKQTRQPDIMSAITGAMSGANQAGAGGGLLGQLAGAALGGKSKGRGANPLMNMLDADGDGSAMDDIFNMLK